MTLDVATRQACLMHFAHHEDDLNYLGSAIDFWTRDGGELVARTELDEAFEQQGLLARAASALAHAREEVSGLLERIYPMFVDVARALRDHPTPEGYVQRMTYRGDIEIERPETHGRVPIFVGPSDDVTSWSTFGTPWSQSYPEIQAIAIARLGGDQ